MTVAQTSLKERQMIRLLLVDDHETLRTSLAFLLDREPDITVAGQAGTMSDALELDFNVDVLLLDLDLPDGSGAALIPQIRARNPSVLALVLTGSTDATEYARAIEQGATGVLHKAASMEEVLRLIRSSCKGEPVHTPAEIVSFMHLTAQRRARDSEIERLRRQLTPREYDLLVALADGLSDREIAEKLHVSPRTVQSHMLNLMDKFGVHSRLQVLTTAVRHGFVQIDAD
jgi:DNA-binding NarL/FixJ family response regulator